MKSYDLDVSRIRLINNISNCTFRVDTHGGESYALRVNMPEFRTIEEIRSKLIWQEALCRETDVPAPVPLRTRDGDLVVEADSPGVPEPRVCNVSSWVQGRMLSRTKTTENLRRLGSQAAQLHAHGERFTPPPGFTVPTLRSILPDNRPDLLFDGEPVDPIPDDAYTLMQSMKTALDVELDRLYRSGEAHIIHGDLHWWNVLIYRGTLHPIDFEDCAFAFPIQDIAITFYYILWDDRYEELLDAFRAGYEEHRPWPEAYPGQLDLLIGQRALDLINLLLNSSYREDRELIPEFIDIVDTTYRAHFERWQSQQQLWEPSCNPSLS